MECVSKDLNLQLSKLLMGSNAEKMMCSTFQDFECLYDLCTQVFHTWDDQVKEFTTVARDMTRKRNEKFIPIKVQPFHSALAERLEFLYQFRKQHEQLICILKKAELLGDEESLVSLSNGGKALDDVNQAFHEVTHVDPLDLSKGWSNRRIQS